jgi:hypothetical protein
MALIKRKVKKEVARDGEVTVVKKKVKILKRPACMFPFQIGMSTDGLQILLSSSRKSEPGSRS